MSLLDSNGRPIKKAEVEALTRRGVMLPAEVLFGRYDDNLSQNATPFVVTSQSAFTDPREEVASSWLPNSQPSSSYGNLNPRFAQKNPIAQLNIPRDTQGLMTQSLTYAQENYIVSRAIRVKRNFALRDLQFLGSPTTVEFYKSEFRRLRLRSILAYAFRYYWTTGRCVVYWGDERPVQRLAILDPRYIIVRRVLGQSKVFLIPDPRWKQILGSGFGLEKHNAQEAQFLKANLPRYWIKHILAEQPIPLKDESYALIENDLELFAMRGIDSPSNIPLQPIFQNLATMEMLTAGDFSVAWMLKHMIALVSIGDPEAEGPQYTRPDQTELNKLEATFNRPDKSMWAYVDPTVDVRFIAPDPALFNEKKYIHHVEAIEWCMGVPPVFSRSDGNFASSTMSIKPFREEIEVARADIDEQLLSKLFPVLREGYTARKSGNKDPEVSFDNDCLKDDRVVTDELTAKYDRGGLSVRSLVEGKAQSFDVETQRKLEELKMAQKHPGIFVPQYDASHGLQDPGDEGGRPNEGGTPTPESQHGQAPRPSRGT